MHIIYIFNVRELAETFRGRLESDMDPLAGPLTFSRESRPSLSWRQVIDVGGWVGGWVGGCVAYMYV
jgi:hypothetical protein